MLIHWDTIITGLISAAILWGVRVLTKALKSPVGLHTVMLVTGEGFVLDSKSYTHEAESEGA